VQFDTGPYLPDVLFVFHSTARTDCVEAHNHVRYHGSITWDFATRSWEKHLDTELIQG
jgi:hypothetical protein